MATTSNEKASADPVYRCACSWVGGDPDTIHIGDTTCPKCISAKTHTCKGGGSNCRHCDRCDHAWDPTVSSPLVKTCPACWHHDRKRVAVRIHRDGDPHPFKIEPTPAKPRPLPDLFKDAAKSKVMSVLRWLVQEGEVSAKAFKQAHVDLGGTLLSTHAFDRYFDDKTEHWRRGRTVPSDGTHALLRRIVQPGQRVNKRNGTVRWVGSEGATFFERARGWFDRMTLTPTEQADLMALLESRVTADQSEESRQIALTWFRAAQSATPTVRLPVRKASSRASSKRKRRSPDDDANEVSTSAA